MITRPLLAGTVKDLSDLKYPILCTPKIDGIRILKVDDKVVTRKFKEVPNRFIRSELESLLPNGADGEIIIPNKSFNDTQSAVMSFEGEPDYTYCMFDYVVNDLSRPYYKRMEDLKQWINNNPPNKQAMCFLKIDPIIPIYISNEKELLHYEESCLKKGYEGVMIRSEKGPYKCGRSTVREGILLKLKRFADSEAIVIGFEEKLSNKNIQEKDEFGLSKRSSKKEGKVKAGTLGSLLVKDIKTNIEFGIGSGFDDELKEEIWGNQKKYLNKIVKYKYQPTGIKEAPRFPVFLGFRSKLDM